MDYVILDLEWDSVYFVPEKRFINQILQIGAVRLNSEFEIIDTFEATVRSSLSKKVTSRFTQLTGITNEKMLSGVPLVYAVEGYNRFCEGAEVTMTWSDTDLYTIVENQKTLLKDEKSFYIDKYLDLQKLVQGELTHRGYEGKNQISLESAAAFLKVDTSDYELHTALDDSLICAKLLKICYQEKHFNALLHDAKNPDFFARLRFKSYPITSLKDKNVDQSQLEFLCPKCNAKAERLGSFKYRNRWFMANFRCNECKYKFSGRVSFKKTYDSVEVSRRICKFYRRKRKKPNEMQPMPEKV